jgi:hypothetical protein
VTVLANHKRDLSQQTSLVEDGQESEIEVILPGHMNAAFHAN